MIAGNTAVARSQSGDAQIIGAGVLNNSLLTCARRRSASNVGRAFGAGGTAQGGGIWNGVLLSGPPVELTLDRSLVTGNALFASPGSSGSAAACSPPSRSCDADADRGQLAGPVLRLRRPRWRRGTARRAADAAARARMHVHRPDNARP